MQDITTQANMRETISQLETQREIEQKSLKDQLEVTYESLKPANLIKSTLKEVVGSKEIRGNVVNASIGIAAGMLTRKLFVGLSGSPTKKVLGTLLMFGITKLISQRPDIIANVGKRILQFVGRKKNAQDTKELSNGAYDHEE